MNRDALPWILLSATIVVWAAWCSAPNADATRAQEAEDSIAVLEPLVDSLLVEAEKRDTVLVTVTDTVRQVVTRERVVQVAVVDTLYATLDPAETVLLDSLLASEEREDVAQELLRAETLAWGTAWKEAAEALQLENEQLRLRGDAWERAYRSSQTSRWVERVGFVLTVACVAKC